jgi:hypothetical protein
MDDYMEEEGDEDEDVDEDGEVRKSSRWSKLPR